MGIFNMGIKDTAVYNFLILVTYIVVVCEN